jgi:DNA-binding transcriptional ArsR family regulator
MNAVPTPELTMERLRALANPIRSQIIEVLTSQSCTTATELAAKLGESTGTTSYHLRQLEKHGFVREEHDRGNARDRWWELNPEVMGLLPGKGHETTGSPATTSMVWHEIHRAQDEMLCEFVDKGRESLGDDWVESSSVLTARARLTPAALRELTAEWNELLRRFTDAGEIGDDPDARSVQIQFNAFPIVTSGSRDDSNSKEEEK